MAIESQQSVLFDGVARKPVSVVFDRPAQSSDAGAILLGAIDQRLRLAERLAGCIPDRRQPHKVDHALVDLFRERIFAIACGYPDCNDATRLADDPVLKLVCQRDPNSGNALASQPTLSRFENARSRTDLLRIAYELTDIVISEERRRRRANKVRRITIDMDPTDDPTYGEQQLTFFNTHYDNYCYLPMVTTIQFDGEAEQILVAPVLRPGSATGSLGAISILKRLLPRLHRAFPRAQFRVRADGAFATPEFLDWLEAKDLEYLVNMPKNSVLNKLAEPLMNEVRARAEKTQHTETAFAEGLYQSGTWKHQRRVIIKAEVVALEGRPLRDNPRFVVNNLRNSPKATYRLYAQRGDMENRIKELHDGLDFDRTSCTAFLANQFRNLLTAAAYVLYQQLRRSAAGTDLAHAQVQTLRERLIKIGTTVLESVRRVVLQCPESFPWFTSWQKIAFACGALSG